MRFALPLATALRQSLIDQVDRRKANEGHRSKVELVYKYFTGVQFKQRIEGIVERFSDMRRDLDRERAAMMRIWAKREAQLQAVLDGSAGLYGDIQGIAGRATPEIQQLSLHLGESAPPVQRSGSRMVSRFGNIEQIAVKNQSVVVATVLPGFG